MRRAWLAEAFLTRSTPPKNAEAFLALAVVHGEHTEDYNRLYTTLTKGEAGYTVTERLVARAEAAPPRQGLMLALALLVCEWESGTSRTTWRHPRERDHRYLSGLIEWGYKPSDVEQLIHAAPTQADDDTADAASDAEDEATGAAPYGDVGPNAAPNGGALADDEDLAVSQDTNNGYDAYDVDPHDVGLDD